MTRKAVLFTLAIIPALVTLSAFLSRARELDDQELAALRGGDSYANECCYVDSTCCPVFTDVCPSYNTGGPQACNTKLYDQNFSPPANNLCCCGSYTPPPNITCTQGSLTSNCMSEYSCTWDFQFNGCYMSSMPNYAVTTYASCSAPCGTGSTCDG